MQVVSDLKSEDVLRKLQNYEIDVGITYIRDPLPADFHVAHLYMEKYVLLDGRQRRSFGRAGDVGGCCSAPPLPAGSSNAGPASSRRRVRRSRRDAFAPCGDRLGVIALRAGEDRVMGNGRAGRLASRFRSPPGMFAAPLTEPERAIPVGLVTLAREPAPSWPAP